MPALALQFPEGPWLYTGALENHPDLVDRIASERPLWGNPGAVLRRVRDPILVADALAEAGIPRPDVRADPRGIPRDGSWLIKPIRSAGGRAVRLWTADAPDLDEASYWQGRIDGPSFSASYCAGRAGTTFLGLTRQFVGRPGAPFAYRGSLGPWLVSGSLASDLGRIGDVLSDRFGLRGLFGVDLILIGSRAFPVEINPRYSASMEVLELATGRAFLGDHRRAFEAGFPAIEGPKFGDRRRFVAKTVLFAKRASKFRDRGRGPRSRGPWVIPRIADIPEAGSTFRPGEPILTIFASGSSIDSTLERLDQKVRAWKAWVDPGNN